MGAIGALDRVNWNDGRVSDQWPDGRADVSPALQAWEGDQAVVRTRLDDLFRVGSPYIQVGLGEPERRPWIPSVFYARDGMEVCVRQVRGWKMRSTPALMTEFGAALQFFVGFGENWHALEECLSDLDEWLPADAYVLVVERAEEVLADELGALPALLTTLDRAGSFWSHPIRDNGRFNRPAIPFHVLLHLSDAAKEQAARFVEAARDGAAGLATQ